MDVLFGLLIFQSDTTFGTAQNQGATDEANEGTWEWIDGTPFAFQNWGPGQPDNTRDGNPLLVQNYLASHPNSRWDDWEIDEASGDYILEKDTETTTITSSHLSIRDLAEDDLHATILKVAQARAQNGAEQMQLRKAAELNASNAVNLPQALSRIQDADIAQITVDLARTKVMVQAGTAMSPKATALYQTILRLIDSSAP